jgi:hypothetical protein
LWGSRRDWEIQAGDKRRLMRRKEEFRGKKRSLASEMVRFLLCFIFTLITEVKRIAFLSIFFASDD